MATDARGWIEVSEAGHRSRGHRACAALVLRRGMRALYLPWNSCLRVCIEARVRKLRKRGARVCVILLCLALSDDCGRWRSDPTLMHQ